MSVKLAIVGLGLIGKRHANIVQSVPKTELSAIVDPNPQTQSIAHGMGCKWFPSLTQMLAEHKPDGVILATPTQMHIEQCVMCVQHDLPVLVEKPLCNDTAEAKPLLDLAQERHIPILTGYHRRYNPKIQAARMAIEQGHLGQLRAVATQCWFYKPDYYFDQAPWRKQLGAGPISVNLAHVETANDAQTAIEMGADTHENQAAAGLLSPPRSLIWLDRKAAITTPSTTTPRLMNC